MRAGVSKQDLTRWLGFAAVASASALLLGCPSYSSMTTAKAVTPGQFELGVSPGATGLSYGALGGSGAGSSGMVVIPNVDFGVRYGFHERFDAAFQISGWGNFGVDAKVNFLDTEHFALAIDPGVNSTFLAAGENGAAFVQYQIPLLVDIAPADWVRITLGPRYVGLYAFSNNESAYENFVGGSVGLEFVASKRIRLQPHAGLVTWLGDTQSSSNVLFSAGFAIKFRIGDPYEKEPPPPQAARR
ncbi:hypothetical protein [Chondromyces crocatus]|uniref:Outer membrane protein beta-barrel domain-containing protein n=1 Tax=Chondromyces crocatus TaxID=52 RepID=A0A0K1E644_CHOCO|nr:hypothetical protein [Chondromyces crocatus]AKT36345.1 uncharacterized protein CMC5_004580 [Chondromyces crocatus]